MCSTSTPKNLLVSKVQLLLEAQDLEEALGAPRIVIKGTVVDGSGALGDLGRVQFFKLRWAHSPEGKKKLMEQAREQGIDFPLYLAQREKRWNAEIAAAQERVALYKPALARKHAEIHQLDEAHPELRGMSIPDIQAILADGRGDDTNLPASRLGIERTTQEDADVELDAVATRAS